MSMKKGLRYRKFIINNCENIQKNDCNMNDTML